MRVSRSTPPSAAFARSIRRYGRLLWFLLLVGSLLASRADILDAQAAPTTLFTWKAVASAPLTRAEAQGAAVGSKLYVLGGFYDTTLRATVRADVYNLATNTWVRIADVPEPLTHAAQAVDGTTLYLVGGYVGNNPGPSSERVWKYDTVNNTWSAGVSLPAQRGGGAVVRVGRQLHFVGGATRSNSSNAATVDCTNHFVFDLDTGTNWTSAAPLPNPRNHLGAVELGGKIYVIGGQHTYREGTENQAQVDVYDPATDTWTRAADLPLARGHISASTLFTMNNRIVIIGGSANDGASGKALSDVTMFDPQTNLWLRLPPLPGGRKTPVAGVYGSQIIVATGGTGSPTATTWVGTFQSTWEKAPALPTALGEVAGGIIGNTLYVVGEGSSVTAGYNLSTGTWSSTSALAQRPYAGNHHAAEVVGGKLYLLGGLGSGAGKVQIYDPSTNGWSVGADMPFAAGSSSSALINGEMYVAGGIIGSSTTTRAAKYNPTSDRWTTLAPMPHARNHAAAATDGTRLYVFGGRGPGSGDNNTVANGFDTLQIYDPSTNQWTSSLDAGSTLAPLPQARGGMGKAVYLGGEFYVIGGETTSGVGATINNVYSRVDIYNPQTNTWRQGTATPTARHGIFPLQIADRIYVAGGGVRAGSSKSTVLEIYNPSVPTPLPAATPSATATATATSTDTTTPTPTITATITITATVTATATATATYTPTVDAAINTPTATVTASSTATSVSTPSASTPTPSASTTATSTTATSTAMQTAVVTVTTTPTASLTPTATQPVVTHFTLINADTDQPIPGFDPLPPGATLNLARLPSRRLNIRANTNPAVVGSVKFGLDANASYRIENTAIYALAGNNGNDYAAWTPNLGTHTLTGTAYTSSNATGTAGTPLTISFTVTDDAS